MEERGHEPCPCLSQLTLGQEPRGSWGSLQVVSVSMLGAFRVGIYLTFQSHGSGVGWVHPLPCTLVSACLLLSLPWAAGKKAVQV